MAVAEIEDQAREALRVTEDDRCKLPLYAALLDAADEDMDWREAAATILGLDVADAAAEACWRSHLERARWIIGEGLGQAIEAFGQRNLG